MTRGASAARLRKQFDGLAVPVDADARGYASVILAKNSRYRIARDSSDAPCLLIDTTRHGEVLAVADLVASNLSVSHGRPCVLLENGVETGRGIFTIVRCATEKAALRSYFFDCAETLLRGLGESPTADEVADAIANLVELFRLISRPPQGTVQGLWAELWLIARAASPERMAAAWHAEPTDAYDFNQDDQRIEVKSSAHRSRAHRFSHRQLTPPTETTAVICSIWVEPAGGGLTIRSLIREIRSQVADDALVAKIDHTVARTLGSSWELGLESGFDDQLATDSLKFFDVATVPALPTNLPAGVSQATYVSDLRDSQDLPRARMRAAGGLLRIAVPGRR